MDFSGLGGFLKMLYEGSPLGYEDYPNTETFKRERPAYLDDMRNLALGNMRFEDQFKPEYNTYGFNDPTSRLREGVGLEVPRAEEEFWY